MHNELLSVAVLTAMARRQKSILVLTAYKEDIPRALTTGSIWETAGCGIS